MTAIGQHTAVVGLGISCQTAHQIRVHAPMLGELLGERMEIVRAPFDWMISPLASTAAMVRNADYFPRSMQELERCTHTYWPRHDCFFWHEDETFDHPAYFHARFARAAANMDRVADVERKIFIVSNTQNALPGIIAESGGFDPFISDAGLDTLQEAIDQQYGRSELYAVIFPGYNQAAASDRVFHIRRDRSVWKGARSIWEQVLRTIALERGAATRTRIGYSNAMLTRPNPIRRGSAVSGSISRA